MSNHNDTIPDGFKRCSQGDNCAHPEGPVLPATLEYFGSEKRNQEGLAGRCKECERYRKQTPEYKEKQRQHRQKTQVAERRRQYRTQYYQNNREHLLKYAHDRWVNNPEVRARAYQLTQHPETKEKRREYARKQRQQPGYEEKRRHWQEKRRSDPVKRARDLQYLRDRHKDPEFRKKKREYEQRPEVRERQIERLRNRRLKPEFREYMRGYNRRPYVRHKAIVSVRRRQARMLSVPDEFTKDDYNYALAYFNGLCPVCERPLVDLFGERKPHADHWIPLSSPDCPGTVPENMVILCGGINGCNQSKGAKDPLEWLVERYGKRKANQINARIQAFFATVRRT